MGVVTHGGNTARLFPKNQSLYSAMIELQETRVDRSYSERTVSTNRLLCGFLSVRQKKTLQHCFCNNVAAWVRKTPKQGSKITGERGGCTD
jgi:hypothetical protein